MGTLPVPIVDEPNECQGCVSIGLAIVDLESFDSGTFRSCKCLQSAVPLKKPLRSSISWSLTSPLLSAS